MAAVLPAISLAGVDAMLIDDPQMHQPNQAVPHFQQLALTASASDVSMGDVNAPLLRALLAGEGPWPMEQDTDYLPIITALLNLLRISNQPAPGNEALAAVPSMSSVAAADIAATALQRSYQRGFQDGQRLANTDRESAERLVHDRAYTQGVIECIREAEARFFAARDQIAFEGYREGWIHGEAATFEQALTQAVQAVNTAFEQVFALGRSRGIAEVTEAATRHVHEQTRAREEAESARKRDAEEIAVLKTRLDAAGSSAETTKSASESQAKTAAEEHKRQLDEQAEDHKNKIAELERDLRMSRQALKDYQLVSARELCARQNAIQDLTTHIVRVHGALDESRSTVRRLRVKTATEISYRDALIEERERSVRGLVAQQREMETKLLEDVWKVEFRNHRLEEALQIMTQEHDAVVRRAQAAQGERDGIQLLYDQLCNLTQAQRQLLHPGEDNDQLDNRMALEQEDFEGNVEGDHNLNDNNNDNNNRDDLPDYSDIETEEPYDPHDPYLRRIDDVEAATIAGSGSQGTAGAMEPSTESQFSVLAPAILLSRGSQATAQMSMISQSAGHRMDRGVDDINAMMTNCRVSTLRSPLDSNMESLSERLNATSLGSNPSGTDEQLTERDREAHSAVPAPIVRAVSGERPSDAREDSRRIERNALHDITALFEAADNGGASREAQISRFITQGADPPNCRGGSV